MLRITPKQQRDIHIKVFSSIKRIIVEVKSRHNPFTFKTVDVGMVKTRLLKKFNVSYVAVIDQDTKEVRIIKANEACRKSKWLIRKSIDVCYSVPIYNFITFDEWVLQLLVSFI